MGWVKNRGRTLVGAFASGTLAILAAGLAAPADATDGLVTFTGTVRLADGTPVAGLRVGYGWRDTTDADGAFSITTTLDRVAEQNSRLVVHPRQGDPVAGVPSRLRVVWPQAEIDNTQPLEITLPPFVEQRFEVLDAHGNPARYWGAHGRWLWDPAPPGGSASGLGAARIFQTVPEVRGDEATLVVADPDYGSINFWGQLEQGERWGLANLPGSAPVALGERDVLTLRLPEPAKVRGLVQDFSGSPLHAQVRLQPFDGGDQIPWSFNTTDAAGMYRLRTAQDFYASMSVDGQEPAASIEGEGTLTWSGGARVHVGRATSLNVRMSEIVRQVVRVSQGAERIGDVQLSGVQEAVGGSVLKRRGGWRLDAEASVAGTTGADGSVRLPAFQSSLISSVNAQVRRHHPTHSLWIYRSLPDFYPGSDVLDVKLPAVSQLTGRVDMPQSWSATMESYGIAGSDRGSVEASSDPGHDLHLGFDPRGSDITFSAETPGRRAPQHVFAYTPISGQSTRSRFTAPRPDVHLRVRAVDHQGDPVAGVWIRTDDADRAAPKQLFARLDKSEVWQELRDTTGARGRVRFAAYRDRAMDLEIVAPLGQSIHIEDFTLLNDRKLLVLINRTGAPVLK